MSQIEPLTCRERVSEPPGYWHHHACGRRAKWWVIVYPAPGDKRKRPVCGIHVKWHQRNGEVLGPVGQERPE